MQGNSLAHSANRTLAHPPVAWASAVCDFVAFTVCDLGCGLGIVWTAQLYNAPLPVALQKSAKKRQSKKVS